MNELPAMEPALRVSPESDPAADAAPFHSDAPAPAGTVPTAAGGAAAPSTDERLDAMVAEVLAVPTPEYKLFDMLLEVRAQQDLPLMAELFERLIWRIPVKSVNPYRVMMDAYLQLRRVENAFDMAAFVIQLDDDPRTIQYILLRLFEFLMVQERPRHAFDVLLRHHELFPEEMPLKPASEIARIAGLARREVPEALRSDDDAPLPANATRIPVLQERPEEFVPLKVVGAPQAPPFLSGALRTGGQSAIDVVRIENGRFLIRNQTVVVLDGAGQIGAGLSFCEFPGIVKQSFGRRGDAVPHEVHEAETAVLIADKFCSGGNLCHFLLDHVSRLWLYEQAGVDLPRALVVGAPRRQPFEFEALRHLGISRYVDADRDVEVRARQLYVSSNCRIFKHPADGGAAWAVDYLRRAFLPPEPSPAVRIYVSRRGASGRRVTNEEAVEALLGTRGFVTIAAESMTWSEQVRMFAGATHVVAPHGAGLTNAIFAQPGARVLEMFHPLYGSASYAPLGKAAKWDYTAMMARDWQSDAPELNDPFLPGFHTPDFGNRDLRVDLGELERWLDDVA